MPLSNSLASKGAGDPIRAADWNELARAVLDITSTITCSPTSQPPVDVMGDLSAQTLRTRGDVVVGTNGDKVLHTRKLNGKDWSTDNPDHLFIQHQNGKDVYVGWGNADSNLTVFGDVRVTQKLSLWFDDPGDSLNFEDTDPIFIRRVRRDFNKNDLQIIVGDDVAGDDRFVIGSGPNGLTENLVLSNDGQLKVRGNVTVGAGGNGILNVRHIDGKNHLNDAPDGLFLNYSTGKPVVIGNPSGPAPLTVYGSLTVQNTAFISQTLDVGGPIIARGSATISGSLHVDGEVRLGAGTPGANAEGSYVRIGGNRTGPFIQFNDDLWFSDLQNGEITLRNHDNSDYGKLRGYFYGTINNISSATYKRDIRALRSEELDSLLDEAIKMTLVTFRWIADSDDVEPSLGIIAEDAPACIVDDQRESIRMAQYVTLLAGAIQSLHRRVVRLEGSIERRPEDRDLAGAGMDEEEATGT